MESMVESVYNSYKIIVVILRNFIKSNYCSYEFDIVKYWFLNRKDECFIMIRIDKEDCYKFFWVFWKRIFIDYFNLLERFFWENKLFRFFNVLDGFGD